MAALFRRHDPASRTRYQDLKQLAQSQARVLAGTPGLLKRRTQSGNQYWVREHVRVDGRKVDEYLGPAASLPAARLEQARREVDLARGLAAGSAQLRLFGYQRMDRKPAAVLEVFFNRGLHAAGLALVGSHAYGVLLNELGIIAPGYRTQDIDVARAAALELAMPDGLTFQRLLSEPSLKLAFPVKELGAHAQAVPLLDFLIDDPQAAVVLSPNQVVPVNVPAPERFVLHKLFSSQSRRGARDKARKDLEQAATLAAALEEDAPESLLDTFRGMPPRGKPAVKRGARAAALIAEGAHPQAAETLRKMGR